MISQHLLFFFSALGAFNGCVLALYLGLKNNATQAQRWLAWLILMVSVRTGKSVMYYFWPELPKWVLQVGLSACFLIGPALYFFVRASLEPQAHSLKQHALHCAALFVLLAAFNLVFPYSENPALWRGPVIAVISYSWLAYTVCSAAYLYAWRTRFTDAMQRLLLCVTTLGVMVIWLAYYLCGYTSYLVGALSFSFLLAASLFVYISKGMTQSVALPYQHRKIDENQASAELLALAELMERERLYLDPGLNLARLSRRLGMPQARLSQLLNDNNQTSFKAYLTDLRINEAKRLLKAEPEKPLEWIALASGFQSVSTFYAAFKKRQGSTPNAFRHAQGA